METRAGYTAKTVFGPLKRTYTNCFDLGSAVWQVRAVESGLGFTFPALRGFPKLFSQVMLNAARTRLRASR